MPVVRVILPWAPQRWMTPEPAKATPSHSLLRDMPTVADEDRSPLILQDLISITVAMDVISTWTKSLTTDPTVLANLCALLRRFALLGDGTDDTETLLTVAASPGGGARALLADRLTRLLMGQRSAADYGALSTPKSVTAAVRRLEAATALLVREAILRLAAKDALDSQHI